MIGEWKIKRINFFIKEYWFIIIGVLLAPIILSQIVRIPLDYLTIGKEGDWIGFLGNYSGGIIGGIVAFLVARHQIKKQEKREQMYSLSKELPSLVGIRLECEKILGQLNNIKKDQEKFDRKDSYVAKFDALIWQRWENIYLLNDPILQEELIKHLEALQRNIDVFEEDIRRLESELEKKQYLLRRKNISEEDYMKLEREVSDGEMYLNFVKRDKVHYLNELNYCIEKTRKINEMIINREKKIHEVLKNKKYYETELITSPDDYKVGGRS